VNEFVEECRREWKRLGVPDPVANEMALELEADLDEAEAEGVSSEEVLGSGAFDPRSFAAAWATERGLVQRTSPNGHGYPLRARTIAAIGAFALIAVIGVVLVIVASPSGPTQLALAADVGPAVLSPDGRTVALLGPPAVRLAAPPPQAVRIAVAAPDVAMLRPAGDTRVVAVAPHDPGEDVRMLGWVLLAVGLAGATALTALRLSAR
jgi:hypothetical protein